MVTTILIPRRYYVPYYNRLKAENIRRNVGPIQRANDGREQSLLSDQTKTKWFSRQNAHVLLLIFAIEGIGIVIMLAILLRYGSTSSYFFVAFLLSVIGLTVFSYTLGRSAKKKASLPRTRQAMDEED